jgi:phage regulator Rha-like protein
MSAKSFALSTAVVPIERIERKIFLIRGFKVMLDADLAELYQVKTEALNQAVKRNINRFPEDFMFQLTGEELNNWRSQIVMSKPGARMGLRRPPYAFTEHGVAMLSTVLKSKRAVQMNILIIRAFVKLRELLASHKDLAARIEKLEASKDRHASVLALLADEIDKLKQQPPVPRKDPIGFHPRDEE